MDIQTELDKTPSGGICNLGGLNLVVDPNTQYTVPRSMTITNATIGVETTAIPTNPLFQLNGLPNGSEVTFRDITLNGPDCLTWASQTESNASAISWSLAKTWNSTLTLERVTTTGGYGYGVMRSGGGKLRVFDSVLSGWIGGLAFFEGHGGWGDLVMRDTELLAPTNSKYSSVGAYIHPHLHILWERVTGREWNRYLCYLNGSPQSAGHHDLIDVAATDCALIQTGSSSETTLIRCKEQGEARNGGSYFKGPVLSVGSHWDSQKGMIGLLSNNSVKRRFVGDTIAGKGFWLAAGNNTQGTVELSDCTIELDNNTPLKVVSTSTVALRLVSTQFAGSTTRFSVNMEGGTLKLIDTPSPPNLSVKLPAILI